MRIFLWLLFFSSFSLEAAPRVEIPQNLQSWEVSLAQSINAQRSQHRLSPLVVKDNLSAIARQHSQDMANGKVAFGHGGFDKRSGKIMQEGRHCSFGENVAYSYLVKDHLQTAVDGWMNSKGHRENILGDFNETGIGIVFSSQGHCYLTQVFAKRK